jgi:hypothetical protein
MLSNGPTPPRLRWSVSQSKGTAPQCDSVSIRHCDEPAGYGGSPLARCGESLRSSNRLVSLRGPVRADEAATPRSPKSNTPLSRPPTTASPPGSWCGASRTPVTPTPCSHSGAVTRSSPTPTYRHPRPTSPTANTRSSNRVRRPDRWTAGAPAVGTVRRQPRLDPVRRDRPQPAARYRRAGR